MYIYRWTRRRSSRPSPSSRPCWSWRWCGCRRHRCLPWPRRRSCKHRPPRSWFNGCSGCDVCNSCCSYCCEDSVGRGSRRRYLRAVYLCHRCLRLLTDHQRHNFGHWLDSAGLGADVGKNERVGIHSKRQRWRRHPPDHSPKTRTVFYLLSICPQGMKASVALFLLVGVIPLLYGFLLEVVVLMPVKVPVNQTPVYFLWQDWALGAMYTKISIALTFMGPDWWMKAAIEQLYQDGIRRYY